MKIARRFAWLLFLASCGFLTRSGLAQSIVTVVGGASVDRGPATRIALVKPAGVAWDSVGNLYLTDTEARRIWRIDMSDGTARTIAGNGSEQTNGDGGPALEAGIGAPIGLAVDSKANVYFTDVATHGSVIRRVDAVTGIITTVAGSGRRGFEGDGGPATAAVLNQPQGVAVDSRGNLFISDTENYRIRVVDSTTGTISTVAGWGSPEADGDGGLAIAAGIGKPGGIVVDGAGQVFFSDGKNHRVRKVDTSGVMRPVAGVGGAGTSADGTPATAARLQGPAGLAVSANGDVLIAESGSHRVRRVVAATGLLGTVAGTGDPGFSGDGGPATQASLNGPVAVAVTPAGVLSLVDQGNAVLRNLSLGPPGIIRTVAGVGSVSVGDGGPATTAILNRPFQIARTATGHSYIADALNHRVRRVDGVTGTITTVAGTGKAGLSGDGGPATLAALSAPVGIALDSAGNIFIADSGNGRIRRIDAASLRISTYAGSTRGNDGDAGPATEARFRSPFGLALDRAGNLFLADFSSHVVRRVAAGSTIVTTVAGTGQAGFEGDSGPATLARLNGPASVALSSSEGALLIADQENHRVRRVDLSSGLISTVAGNGAGTFAGDGGPATGASLKKPTFVAMDANGNVFITDNNNNRIRRVDAATQRISTMIGSDSSRLSGDLGPASAATINFPNGVLLTPGGDLYFSDTGHNRVRAVFACVSVPPPALALPSDGASFASTTVELRWSATAGAFAYDVLLDTVNPPRTVVAANVTGTSAVLSNLGPGRTHYWQVVAKGDAYCVPASTATSAVRSFLTGGTCGAPGTPGQTSPAAGASGVSTSPTLTWQTPAGAATFDLYLGSTNPPPLKASGIATGSYAASGLASDSVYYWNVVARAGCDDAKVTTSEIRSFRTSGACTAPGPFSLQAPAAGATGQPVSPVLSWSASPGATDYDLYFGAAGDPALYLAGLARNSVQVTGLVPGAAYSWRVVARTSCNLGLTSATPVRAFTVGGSCNPPETPVISFVPPGAVAAGQTYVIAWKDVAGLGSGGSYIVERSSSPTFSPLLDTQTSSGTFASFVATTEGRIYHRVRAAAGCDPARTSVDSDARSVTVVKASPNVVFAVPPAAVVTALGEKLEDRSTSFTLENISQEPISVAVTQAKISQIPFFDIVEPNGESVAFLSLPPRTPKRIEIRFSGVPIDREGSYQGLVVVSSLGAGLAVTPLAFVSLKVGGADTATPEFRRGGVATEYAFFPGFAGDDSTRPPISVDIRNPGSTPMELAMEVGPEVWLKPEPGWNTSPIPPGGSRTVSLRTQRYSAPNGSALPRYTYFTVRTKDVQRSARLLVQDNERPTIGSGRTVPLDRGVRSYVVPSVVNATSKIGNTFVSRLRLSNNGSSPVQADLYYTPASSDVDVDGFDAARVKQATVVVPANDLINITDPLVQLFGLTPPVSGSLEVRANPDQIGSLSVTSAVDAPAPGGGTFGFQMPTVLRGEGARAGSPHVITGVTATSAFRTNLILSETTGIDGARVRAVLYDNQGVRLGETTVQVARYAQRQISGVVASLGGSGDVTAARVELEVTSGGGSVMGIVTVIDNSNDDSVTYVSRPATPPTGSSYLMARAGRPLWAQAAGTLRLLIPAVVNGYRTFPGTDKPYTFRSLMGFCGGTAASATFHLTYYDLATDKIHEATVTVGPRRQIEKQNVLEELFGLPPGTPSQGPIFVESDGFGTIYCKVYSNLEQGTLGDGFPVVPIPSEGLTGGISQKPIFIDDLEQSIDRTRGTRSNLILNEVLGQATTVTVRLYEAGNRSRPIAEKDVPVGPLKKVQLSTVFDDLGLNTAERRKDRKNVQCVVSHKSGSGLVSAIVTTIDNKTGDTRNSTLSPSGGISASGGTIGF